MSSKSVVRRRLSSWRRIIVSTLAVGSLVAGTAAVAGPAHADTAPPAGTPATVSADALPTVQQNGVVWAQVTVGNTVYATGSFSQTWPAGTTQAQGTTPRANLLAYDLTTGNLITSFDHTLNAQGLGITASPDGSRVYVVGDFTTVDGQTRNHIAAFDTATGALNTAFHPSVSAQVRGVAVTNTTVYFGGNFFNVGGVPRTRLAAANASDGALLSWAPTADDNFVTAMVIDPAGTRVIVGGRFATLSGVAAPGMGAIDASSGAILQWTINTIVKDNGTQCGITTLSTDGTAVYGGGFAYGCGNFEGTFSADINTGNVIFVNDCHGDTYGTYPVGQVLYSVSHAHDCSAAGKFPETNPRTWHHALAWTTYATGTNKGPDSYGWNYNGVPDAALLQWFPTLAIGSVTGQSQAAWTATGNSNYVALGGEFPSVNGKAQAGLVRFAVAGLATNKRGPVSSTSLTPTVQPLGGGSVTVSWKSTWDMDNRTLSYAVYRDGVQVRVRTGTSNFWTLPAQTWTDTGVAPGTHTYQIKVYDAFNNIISSATTTATTT